MSAPANPIPARARSARIALLAADIKISHTLFALPWAVLATFMAAGGWPSLGRLGLILTCMISARTFAMTMNRLLDASLDARNPRTAGRAIPSGQLTYAFVATAMTLSVFTFLGSAAMFHALYGNAWPILLAPPVLIFVGAYPLMKRFTRLCHYYLGAALALAPVCAWVAIAARLDAPPLWMAAAVLLWTAGFDIIYACQDYAIDVAQGVFSVPAAMGIGPALWVARLTHATCLGMLILLGFSSPLLGTLYWIGVVLAGILLTVEHLIVHPRDLSRVNVAFFTLNGLLALTLAGLGIVDTFL